MNDESGLRSSRSPSGAGQAFGNCRLAMVPITQFHVRKSYIRTRTGCSRMSRTLARDSIGYCVLGVGWLRREGQLRLSGSHWPRRGSQIYYRGYVGISGWIRQIPWKGQGPQRMPREHNGEVGSKDLDQIYVQGWLSSKLGCRSGVKWPNGSAHSFTGSLSNVQMYLPDSPSLIPEGGACGHEAYW